MFDVILAMTPTGGIGKNGGLPWRSPADLLIFKQKTMNSTLIMGRKTVRTLPKLFGRTIVCVCKETPLNVAIDSAKSTGRKIFIAGGASIYMQVFKHHMNNIDQIHLTVMRDDFDCDTFIDFDWNKWVIHEKSPDTDINLVGFTHYVLRKNNPLGEVQYLNLLNKVAQTDIKNGRNGETYSSFGEHLKFDLRLGFPLLTTKKMFFRGIVEELLFFIRGQTDSKILERANVNIWRKNTNREFLNSLGDERMSYTDGEIGPMYGYQWRHFNAPFGYPFVSSNTDDAGIDQLKDVIHLIRTNPQSRRILMTNYNPCQAKQGVLYPCHSIILQFYVSGEFLDMFCFNRSSDLFLGLPFNIASSSLLLILIAKVCELTPRFVNISLGDAHIYAVHADQVCEQSKRVPYSLPSLKIHKRIANVKDMEELSFNDFLLENYQSHPTIVAPMVA